MELKKLYIYRAHWKERKKKPRIKMAPLKDLLPISMTNDKPHPSGESTTDPIGTGRWKGFKEFMVRALSRFSFGFIKDDIATTELAEVSDGTKGNTLDAEKTFRDDGDIESDKKGSGTPEANHGKYSPYKLLFWLKWSFYIVNLLLVLCVLVLDLISPENNTAYDLAGVVASLFTLVFGIIDIVWRAKQGEVTWRKKGKIYWFYDPNGMPFGTSADIIGLVCSCLEFIMETVTRFSKDEVKDKPIYTKFFPAILAFFLLVTKCLEEICAD